MEMIWDAETRRSEIFRELFEGVRAFEGVQAFGFLGRRLESLISGVLLEGGEELGGFDFVEKCY